MGRHRGLRGFDSWDSIVEGHVGLVAQERGFGA